MDYITYEFRAYQLDEMKPAELAAFYLLAKRFGMTDPRGIEAALIALVGEQDAQEEIKKAEVFFL